MFQKQNQQSRILDSAACWFVLLTFKLLMACSSLLTKAPILARIVFTLLIRDIESADRGNGRGLVGT